MELILLLVFLKQTQGIFFFEGGGCEKSLLVLKSHPPNFLDPQWSYMVSSPTELPSGKHTKNYGKPPFW